MSPHEAYARLVASGPFDDPYCCWYPIRWYFGSDGVMRREAWRCVATEYPQFVKPKP